jgi:hypothetical protein
LFGDIEARNQEEAERKFEEKELGGHGVFIVEATSDSVEEVTGRIPNGGRRD